MQESKANYRLTRTDIISNIFAFMVAGYETTSTALACTMYELARHPEALHKLQAEIDELPLSSDENTDENTKKYPDYDVVAQMSYMDMVVSEILRMYPIANLAIQRVAREDTIVQGIPIKKGNRFRFLNHPGFIKDDTCVIFFQVLSCMRTSILSITIVISGVLRIRTYSFPSVIKQNVIP